MDLYMRNEKVYVEDCHMFWRKLEISESAMVSYTDIDRFKAIVDEAISTNPTICREATLILSDLIHPQFEDLENPAIKETFKGRPRVPRKKSTTRNPSYFEYIQQEFPTSETTSQGNTQINPDNSQPTSSFSEKGGAYHMPNFEGYDFPYLDLLPEVIVNYLCGWYNPKADGHCGFRAMSHAIRGDEEHWMLMRVNLLGEIRHPKYREVYDYADYDSQKPHARISFPFDRPRRRANWMDSLDLFGYATINCWAICVVAHRYDRNGKHRWDGSSTYLPLRAEPGFRCPITIIWFLHTGDHWVRIKKKDDADILSPMPPIYLIRKHA